MISREADYAIRVILYLSKHEAEDRSLPTSILSKETDVPHQFLRHIVKKLTDGGLVVSKKGKNGGLKLTRKACEISLYDVISVVHYSGICLNKCIDDKENCDRTEFCTVYNALKQSQKCLDESLQEITFDRL